MKKDPKLDEKQVEIKDGAIELLVVRVIPKRRCFAL